MKVRGRILAATGMAILAGSGFVIGQHRARLGVVTGAPPAYSSVSAAVLTRAGLPSEEAARAALSAPKA